MRLHTKFCLYSGSYVPFKECSTARISKISSLIAQIVKVLRQLCHLALKQISNEVAKFSGMWVFSSSHTDIAVLLFSPGMQA